MFIRSWIAMLYHHACQRGGYALGDQKDTIGCRFHARMRLHERLIRPQPSDDDVVWRLPPTYATSREDEELKAQYTAIGESNRMTLKFRKPE